MARHSFPCSPTNRRALACAFAVGAIALAACGAAEHSSDANSRGGSANASGGDATTATSGGAGGNSAAAGGSGGVFIQLPPGAQPREDRACTADTSGAGGIAPLFCKHDVLNAAPATRELYSWTTLEQAAELRAGGELFTRSERPGMGPGYAFTYMAERAAFESAEAAAILNGVLENFDKARYAWPHPWATRMGWPGEDYGDQLLRIVLKPEAWVLLVWEGGRISVVDMDNKAVPLSAAAAALDRIGAIFFVKKDVRGSGSFFQCSGGYREFVVGNLAMIEEWSLGTEEIRARLVAEVALIDAFRGELEPAPPAFDPATFNTEIACHWDAPIATNLDRYERSLAIPSENYIPTLANLVALRDTLQASVFDPDPLIVKPGQ